MLHKTFSFRDRVQLWPFSPGFFFVEGGKELERAFRKREGTVFSPSSSNHCNNTIHDWISSPLLFSTRNQSRRDFFGVNPPPPLAAPQNKKMFWGLTCPPLRSQNSKNSKLIFNLNTFFSQPGLSELQPIPEMWSNAAKTTVFHDFHPFCRTGPRGVGGTLSFSKKKGKNETKVHGNFHLNCRRVRRWSRFMYASLAQREKKMQISKKKRKPSQPFFYSFHAAGGEMRSCDRNAFVVNGWVGGRVHWNPPTWLTMINSFASTGLKQCLSSLSCGDDKKWSKICIFVIVQTNVCRVFRTVRHNSAASFF